MMILSVANMKNLRSDMMILNEVKMKNIKKRNYDFEQGETE